MKKQFIHILIILFFLTNCASKNKRTKIVEIKPIVAINDSIKDKLEVLNDFLDTKIKDRSKKIMIHSKKVNINMTLRILRINDIYVLDSITGKFKEDKTFYEEYEWEKTRMKYSKNSSISQIEKATFLDGECCWIAEHFNYKNIIFEELEFGTSAYEKKYFSGLDNYDDFYFSEPIYYKNKEYLIFTFSHGCVFPTENYSTSIIIYQKKNGKWVQTHEGLPNWFS